MDTQNLLTEFIFDPDNKVSGISFGTDYKIKNSEDIKLNDVRKMNIFVGQNNSGKSRIIRSIFSQEHIMLTDISKLIINFVHSINIIFQNSPTAQGQFNTTKQDLRVLTNLMNVDYFRFQDPSTNYIQALKNIKNEITTAGSVLDNQNFWDIQNDSSTPELLRNIFIEYAELFEKINNLPTISNYYIPVLRGMLPLTDDSNKSHNFYLKRVLADHFPDLSNGIKNKYVHTGFEIYTELQNKRNGQQKDVKFTEQYVKFLEENFFNGQDFSLVPTTGSNGVVSLNFGENEDNERPISKLGDGLQSILAITYPIFSWLFNNKNNINEYLIVSIEEPELFLHPAMQRKLVQVLLSDQFKNIQYFVTTHSNHFLDLFYEAPYSEQVSVYSVNMDDNNLKTISRENDLSNSIYDLLGVTPSSILLANKSIWVEGISDRIYIRHAIKLYLESTDYEAKNKPSEDYDYTFIEFGGSNLDHYILDEQKDLDISLIANAKNVYMIVDDDGTKDDETGAKSKRYNAISKQLTDKSGKFSKTSGREIENYIKPDILRSIWSKLPIDIEHSAYLDEPLPAFLQSKNCKVHITDNRFRNKKMIAEKITSTQMSWSDLSIDMQVLTKEIVNFINT